MLAILCALPRIKANLSALGNIQKCSINNRFCNSKCNIISHYLGPTIQTGQGGGLIAGLGLAAAGTGAGERRGTATRRGGGAEGGGGRAGDGGTNRWRAGERPTVDLAVDALALQALVDPPLAGLVHLPGDVLHKTVKLKPIILPTSRIKFVL